MTRHLALVGPTASGKSALALELARAADDIELVSLDSMQVYRGLDIGTAKPTSLERAEIVHHLIDVADPSQEWSVQRTQVGARAAIADIEARGKRAMLVGGTGLYVRAVVDDLQIPPTDAALRESLDVAVDDDAGLAVAYARLTELDPVAAARMEPRNRRRIVRALEVIELTGRQFSSFGPGMCDYATPALSVSMLGLDVKPATLAVRIAQRFEKMRADGLVDEVRSLAPRDLSRTAREAIGYREVLAYLAGDIATLDDALDAAVCRTRRFARRQRKWFGRDPRVEWVASSGSLTELTERLLKLQWGSAPIDAAAQ
ncbi:MAG: tRNA (adenosine(37)-N6)-dimethylallyltransferase MiaA [Acidimicrobiia bacterium]